MVKDPDPINEGLPGKMFFKKKSLGKVLKENFHLRKVSSLLEQKLGEKTCISIGR